MVMHPEFPLQPDIVHLNHAGVAPWPRRTVAAVEQFAQENMRRGSLCYARWIEVETRLREQLCRLINAESPDDIALLKSTSEALSVVAYGLDWRPGENVVISRQEFPSNRIVWESLAARFGVEVRVADLDGAGLSENGPEDALLELIDANTRLLAVSSVQYATGLRMDLKRLGEHCRSQDVLFCVDAIQSLGVEPFDVQACRADFVMADGHKWMLGPEGVALFYCRPERRDQLRLNQFGWHMVEHNDFDRLDWEPADSARRFECGSPNSLGIHALSASLELIRETGIETINDLVSKKVDYLIDCTNNISLELLTPKVRERRAGIMTFRCQGHDSQIIYRHLQQAGVLCAQRAGGIRFSPHFYTSCEDLDRAIMILREGLHR